MIAVVRDYLDCVNHRMSSAAWLAENIEDAKIYAEKSKAIDAINGDNYEYKVFEIGNEIDMNGGNDDGT